MAAAAADAVAAGWDTVRRQTRRLSESVRRSPTKEYRQTIFDDNNAPITLTLDGNELLYENGAWAAAQLDGSNFREQVDALTDRNKQLQEENQLLKFKLEILLDMLSVTKLDMLRLQTKASR
ncbi:hypothetical protein RI367_008109 [Sorochytrium milnesiophthora]